MSGPGGEAKRPKFSARSTVREETFDFDGWVRQYVAFALRQVGYDGPLDVEPMTSTPIKKAG